MNSVAVPDEQALREELAKAGERLDGLARNLRAADDELEGLAGEREQHRLLVDACTALEQLDLLGGAGLFWGERAGGEGASQIRAVRSRVDAFQKRVGEIEDRRQGLQDEIEAQQSGAWYLADELVEVEEEARRREQEWIVDREVETFPVHPVVMPWLRRGEEDRRFRRSLAIALALSTLFALVVPWIDLPLPEGVAHMEPERLTRLIMEQRQEPPEPAPPLQPPEQKLAEQKPKPETAKQKEGPGQGPAIGPATGILAFRKQLSAFAQDQQLDHLGAQARIRPTGAAASGVVERSMLTTQAPGSSGGINLSELSRNVTGGGGAPRRIENVQIARVTSAIAGGGGRGTQSKGGDGPNSARTDEEIQIVFDRHKAALYRLYNRELRRDPTLKGQMVLRIRIEPDGSVTLCELQSTDMSAPQLSAQVLERVKTFDFGAKDGIPTITILYPIDFLPAA